MHDFLLKYFEGTTIIKIRNALIIIIVGYSLLQFLAYIVRRTLSKKLSPQSKFLINKVIVYSGIVIILAMVLSTLKVNITALLGAAGVIGIVIGIASQTSIGNVISGIFLISEKIRVDDKMGTVYSIDLLSVKLKTLDNLLIRIPNQTMISTEVTNITRFPIRRMDIDVGVAYKEDLGKVINTLRRLATENPYCLNEPEALILIKEFGESSINILYGLWFEKSNYVTLRNSIIQEIKTAFEAEGIEIPFPHITLYTGEVTKPFPLEVAKETKS